MGETDWAAAEEASRAEASAYVGDFMDFQSRSGMSGLEGRLVRGSRHPELQVAAAVLFDLERLEEGLEVSCSKTLMVSSLNYLDEEGWSIFDWFCEYLKKVSLFIMVAQKI